MSKNLVNKLSQPILSDIHEIIIGSKTKIAKVLSSSMMILYWRIGERIKKDIIKLERAEDGKKVIRNLSVNLSAEHGKGFTYTDLVRMLKFYEQGDSLEIVTTLSQQLTWRHIVELLPIEDKNKRNYYIYTAIDEGWSVRILRRSIHEMNYERSSLAKKPDKITASLIENIKNHIFSPDVMIAKNYLKQELNLRKSVKNKVNKNIGR
jgi:hypothetical protein